MSAPAADDDVASKFSAFAGTTVSRAPLYSRLSRAVADDPACWGILLAAPPTQRQPVLLFAAVHHLLLRDPTHELAGYYPNIASTPRDGDPVPVFREFCAKHRDALSALVAERQTQTNEVGRCALLVPALSMISAEVGEPLALLDVGASGGLNLLVDRYQYVYTLDGIATLPAQPSLDPTFDVPPLPGVTSSGAGHASTVEQDDGSHSSIDGSGGGDISIVVGDPSPVIVECAVRGRPPIADHLPPIAHALGLDQSPVDLTNPDEARWLEACVWPDQWDRFARLRAAIELAASDPPTIVRGDAVADVAGAIESVGQHGHPTVINSWVLNYLTVEQRRAYLDRLDDVGRRRDLSWIYLESPMQIDGLPVPDDPATAHLTVVTSIRWRSGRRRIEHLATAHPHGYWLHWR